MQSITFQPLKRLSPAELLEFSKLNRDLICELNANGSIVLKTPFRLHYTAATNYLIQELERWNERSEHGAVFSTRYGFVLKNGAIRHPALAWVKNFKMVAQIDHLIEHVPDFWVEYLTESESLSLARVRMQEYLSNGAKLGWLIDLQNERIYVFEENRSVLTVEGFENKLSGGEILRGIELDLAPLR